MLKQITLSLAFIFFIVAMPLTRLRAQTPVDSLTGKAAAYNNITDKFYIAIGGQSRLYNGEEYDDYYHGITGSPFFLDAPDWGTGNIDYDGFIYKNVKITYDLYKDAVVIPLYGSFLRISLINDKLTSFNLFGHHFIYVKNDAATGSPVKSGIYDQLYGSERLKVLCKRSKSIQQDHTLNGITSYFSSSIDYYVFKDNQYFTTNSTSEFLDVFKDKKKNIRQFINANKIKFKKDTKEQAMARVAEYYDHLTQ